MLKAYMTTALLCIFVLGAVGQEAENKGVEAIEEGQRIRITLQTETDAIRKDTLNGPGIFDFTIGVKPENETYKDITISSGESLEITNFPEVEGETTFYYRFVPCQSLKIPEGISCEILLNEAGQRSLEIVAEGIQGPVTIFYIDAGKEGIDQFTLLPNYDLKRATPNQTLRIFSRIGKEVTELKNIAVVQYPKQTPPSPADTNKRKSKPPGGQVSSIEQNTEEVKLPAGYRDLGYPTSFDAENLTTVVLSKTRKRVDWLGDQDSEKHRIVTWQKVHLENQTPRILRFQAKKGGVGIEINADVDLEQVQIAALHSNRDLWKFANLTTAKSTSKPVKTITLEIPGGPSYYSDYPYFLFMWNTENNRLANVTIKTSHTLEALNVGVKRINFERDVVKGKGLTNESFAHVYKLYQIKIPRPGTLAVNLSGQDSSQLRAQVRGTAPAIASLPAFEGPSFEIHTPGTYLLKIDHENGVSSGYSKKFKLTLSFKARVELWDVENAEPLVDYGDPIEPPY